MTPSSLRAQRSNLVIVGFVLLTLSACKTKSELRREQELAQLKQEVSQVRGTRADSEVLAEEIRVEMSRLGNVVEQQAALNQKNYEELKQEMTAVTARLQALEQRAVAEETRPAAPEKPAPGGYDAGKRLFEDGQYDEAIEILRPVAKNKKGEEGRKSLFLLGESYFATRDYASAALEFSEYKKKYPKDSLVPNAIYRQANAFRSMGKPKEAKLFYQELIDKYPKNNLTAKAKTEMKKLK